MSDFHYLIVPGDGGGVERAEAGAVGISLAQAVEDGVPPLSVALALIAALAELLAILEDDKLPHGKLDTSCIFIDDTGTVSVEAFGTPGASKEADRFALGCLSLWLLGGGSFEPPGGPDAHEEQVLDQLLWTDLGGLDGAFVGDVQWFVARLLDYTATRRPDPVRVWRSFVAFANATPGERLQRWAGELIQGRAVLRHPAPPPTGSPAPVTLHGTAFLSKYALKTFEEEPAPGGGEKTGYWSAEQLVSMRTGSAAAPLPRRAVGVASMRRETLIRAPPTALLKSSGPLPGEVKIRRRAAHDPEAATIFGPGAEAVIADDRRQFIVEQCLGRGGFGEVYLCTMSSSGGMRSQVAVKVLREGIDPRAQAVRRLRDEARVLGTLQHPAILTALDLVVLDDRVGMVTEYVPGADLDVCMESPDPPSLRALLEVLAVTSEALEASWETLDAHGKPLHLVHRDIKPSNIRIGTHGQVKVLDYGIAKFASTREAKTQANQMIGTLSYMAPERLSSATDHPAGDVYAVGAILYEALAGAGLWGECTHRQQYMLSMVNSEYDGYVMPRIDVVEADPKLKELLRQALHFEPTARPTAGELARTLEDLAESVEGRTLRRWARDHEWPSPEALDAELVGRTITEGRTSVSDVRDRRALSAKTFAEMDDPPAPTPPSAPPPPAPLGGALPTLDGSAGARGLNQTEFGDWFEDETEVQAPPPPPPKNITSAKPRKAETPAPRALGAPLVEAATASPRSGPPGRAVPVPDPSIPASAAPALPPRVPSQPPPAPDPVPAPTPRQAVAPDPTPVVSIPIDDRPGPDDFDDYGYDPYEDETDEVAAGPAWWALLLPLLLGILLFVGAIGVAAGVGLLYVSQSGDTGDIEVPVPLPDPVPGKPTPDPEPGTPDPEPGTPDPEPGSPDPEPGQPTPSPEPGQPTPNPEPGAPQPDTEPSVRPTPRPGTQPEPTAAPVPGPVPGVVPDAEPDDGVAVVEPMQSSGCSDTVSLETQAAVGKLSPSDRSCLSGRMDSSSLSMTDRQKVGRLLLVDAQAGCTKNKPCSAYEMLQDSYFEDLGRSDPDMMLAYAQHLHNSATSGARHRKAILWATRALGRRDGWKGRTRSSKLMSAHQLRALSSNSLFMADPSERNREDARDHVVAWAELRRSLNVDASQAFELCASITGSMDVCDKRISTEAVEEEVLFISNPMGAKLTIDGKDHGVTPKKIKLTHGAHAVKMTSGEKESTKSIRVGTGQASKWQWVSAADDWKPTL